MVEAEGPESATVARLPFLGQVVGACWPFYLMPVKLVRHHLYETSETLVIAERSEPVARERSWEAEAVVPGSQEALHLAASPQARLPLRARLQTQTLHFRVLGEEVEEVALQNVSFCLSLVVKAYILSAGTGGGAGRPPGTGGAPAATAGA